VLRKFQLSFQDDVLLFLDRLVVAEFRLVVLFRDGVGVFVQRGGLKLLLRHLRDVVLLLDLEGGGNTFLELEVFAGGEGWTYCFARSRIDTISRMRLFGITMSSFSIVRGASSAVIIVTTSSFRVSSIIFRIVIL
jgi:hypothetical protein